ncbi:MAG: hypothetical protein SCH98_12110 [Deferrisomatales bacterium]|nr:hypothetical protein [Deferrisomatales bacterium]
MTRRPRLLAGGLLLAAATAVAALTTLQGCGSAAREVQLTRGFASAATPYGALLPRHTRAGELYDRLDTVAKAWATWRSPELRAALAETSVAAYRLEGEAAEALRRRETQESRNVREVHLALYTPKAQWNDLESPQTLWRVFLELETGERRDPLRVTHLVKTDKSAVEYPYVTRWTREYSLVFPVLAGEDLGAPPTLVLAGPLGTLTLPF